MPIAPRWKTPPSRGAGWGVGLLLACAMLWGTSGTALAQACSMNNSLTMDFGTVNAQGASVTAKLNYSCTDDPHHTKTYYYQMCLFIGPGSASAGQPTRRLDNGQGSALRYDLFADPAHTQPIGAQGTTPVYQFFMKVPPKQPGVATASIYGHLYPGQSVPALGMYAEAGLPVTLRYSRSETGFPSTADCSGEGGNSTHYSGDIRAQYANSCTVSATAMHFGRRPPPTSAVQATSDITVQCAPQTAWKIGLGNGQHHDGSTRHMAGSSGTIAYRLYRDSAHTQAWGNEPGSMLAGATNHHGDPATVRVHGEVPPHPDAAMGRYTDTVVVTLYY